MTTLPLFELALQPLKLRTQGSILLHLLFQLPGFRATKGDLQG
jgi:hypothetical protein